MARVLTYVIAVAMAMASSTINERAITFLRLLGVVAVLPVAMTCFHVCILMSKRRPVAITRVGRIVYRIQVLW